MRNNIKRIYNKLCVCVALLLSALSTHTITMLGYATTPPTSIENGQVIGSVSVPAVDLVDTLAVGTSRSNAQKVLETSASLICYGTAGLPGQADIVMIGGHNYMEFNKLKDAKIGDEVILELDNGTLTYSIDDIKIQAVLLAVPTGSLILYTCYPFDEMHSPTSYAYFLCTLKSDFSNERGDSSQ